MIRGPPTSPLLPYTPLFLPDAYYQSYICHIPRSKLDYVELARCFHTVLLSNLRRLDDDRSNIAHRLITLIDALYDRNVNLIASAEAPVTELYLGRDLAFEFQRTASRLIEMQSHEYLARPHLA